MSLARPALAALLGAALACVTPQPPPLQPPPPPAPEPVVEAAPPEEAPVPEAAPAEPAGPVLPEAALVPPAGQASPAAAAVDRSAPPPLGPAEALRLPAQRHFTLGNGLRVRLVEHRRLPIVALALEVDAGAARDPADLPGLATFTAAMVTEGTRLRTATQISDQVGFLGASLGAGAGPDGASLGGACLAEHLTPFLELFADVAANPAFPAGDFERVKDERRVTLLQQRDQPAVVAGKAFAPVFWGSHPYGHPLIGTEAALERTRPADLARFHRRYWHPANAELVVVGDVDEAALRPVLERTLGSWAAGRPAAALAQLAPAAPHRTLLVDKPGAPQSFLLLGAPGLDRRSSDFVEATVMLEVLGGGTASRLFRTLREEKGYTYGISAGADARRLGGASVIRGSVKAEVTGAALKDLLAELRRMREEPVPADELQEAKDGIVRSLPSQFASVAAIAGHLGELATHKLPDDYWNGYAQAVEKVTAAGVQRAARRYLDPRRFTLVVVGASAVVRPQLTGLPLGPVEVPRPRNGLLPRKPAQQDRPAPAPGASAG